MTERSVTHTRKNSQGDITALCSPGAHWSPRSKEDVIHDIKSWTHNYYVQWTDKRTEIHVAGSPPNEYLRTDWDSTTRNNLDDLPDC